MAHKTSNTAGKEATGDECSGSGCFSIPVAQEPFGVKVPVQ